MEAGWPQAVPVLWALNSCLCLRHGLSSLVAWSPRFFWQSWRHLGYGGQAHTDGCSTWHPALCTSEGCHSSRCCLHTPPPVVQGLPVSASYASGSGEVVGLCLLHCPLEESPSQVLPGLPVVKNCVVSDECQNPGINKDGRRDEECTWVGLNHPESQLGPAYLMQMKRGVANSHY